jgi:type IV pilus assembly protein PilC
MAQKKSEPVMTKKIPELKSVVESASTKVNLWTKLNTRLSLKEKLLFTKYLAILLRSGMAIDEAVEVLQNQSKGVLKKILNVLQTYIKLGDTLATGLKQFPQVFDSVFVSLIEVGEASGTLKENLEHLAVQMEKERELRQKIISAALYPSIVIISALSIALGIVVFVLPNILGIFESMKIEIPLSTKILLWVTGLIMNHGKEMVLGLIVLIIAFSFIKKVSFIKPIFHKIILIFPIVGPLAKKLSLARISRVLSLLLESGVPIDTAIDISTSVVKNVHYKKLCFKIKESVAQGSTIAAALKDSPSLIPIMAQHMIDVGEQTGTLDEMLDYLSDFYEKEIDEITKNLALTLEPLLLLFIGGLVGGIVLSILTPIYEVVGSF